MYDGFHFAEDSHWIERPNQESGSTERETRVGNGCLSVGGCNDNDRDLAHARVCLQPFEEIEAAAVGQADIRNNRNRAVRESELQPCGNARRRDDSVAVWFEDATLEFPVYRRVINHQ
jgi:hypothetical protein